VAHCHQPPALQKAEIPSWGQPSNLNNSLQRRQRGTLQLDLGTPHMGTDDPGASFLAPTGLCLQGLPFCSPRLALPKCLSRLCVLVPTTAAQSPLPLPAVWQYDMSSGCR
jgi:hypothetical protein